MTARLPQWTLSWASPLTLPDDEAGGTRATPLLTSSEASWLSSSLKVHPDFKVHPKLGFEKEGQAKGHVLGAVVEGTFRSYYAGKDRRCWPRTTAKRSRRRRRAARRRIRRRGSGAVVAGMIEKSPESARSFSSAPTKRSPTRRFSCPVPPTTTGSSTRCSSWRTWGLGAGGPCLVVDSEPRPLRPDAGAHDARAEGFLGVLELRHRSVGLALIYGAHRYHLRRLRDRYHTMLAA